VKYAIKYPPAAQTTAAHASGVVGEFADDPVEGVRNLSPLRHRAKVALYRSPAREPLNRIHRLARPQVG